MAHPHKEKRNYFNSITVWMSEDKLYIKTMSFVHLLCEAKPCSILPYLNEVVDAPVEMTLIGCLRRIFGNSEMSKDIAYLYRHNYACNARWPHQFKLVVTLVARTGCIPN